VVPNDGGHGDHTHNLVSELVKKCSLEWFREVVCYHFLRWAVLDCHFLASDTIRDKKVANVDVPSARTAGRLTVLRELKITLIVLVE
jgi:hypothetical protein